MGHSDLVRSCTLVLGEFSSYDDMNYVVNRFSYQLLIKLGHAIPIFGAY